MDVSKVASKVKIDKKHFPDKIFREYVKEFDKNKDGSLCEGKKSCEKNGIG